MTGALWIDVFSYLASALVFAAFFMKAIVPLRLVAIGSNIAFIVYALGAGLLPILVLHVALLPLNLWRVIERMRLVRRVREVSRGAPDLAHLLPLMSKHVSEEGDILFRKGDGADALYFLETGEILFEEIGVTIGPGTIFGEIALFLEDDGRSATARCLSRCTIFSLSRARVEELVLTDPSFGLFLTKLIAQRQAENLASAQATGG